MKATEREYTQILREIKRRIALGLENCKVGGFSFPHGAWERGFCISPVALGLSEIVGIPILHVGD